MISVQFQVRQHSFHKSVVREENKIDFIEFLFLCLFCVKLIFSIESANVALNAFLALIGWFRCCLITNDSLVIPLIQPINNG